MHEAAAGRVEPLDRGVAIFDDQLPLLWDLNLVWVQEDEGATATELVADAERVQGAARLAHRRVVLVHEPRWRRLVPGFRAAGYELEVHVFMVHGPEPDHLVPTERVEEVAVEDLAPAMERYFASEPWGRNPETRRQLLEHNRTYGASVEERCFAVREEGEVRAYCKLWARDGTAQVEDVVVLPGHRGRGLGRTVVTAALQAGRALEPDTLFIVADDGDWPKQLYAKLGFEPAGRMGLFTRRL